MGTIDIKRGKEKKKKEKNKGHLKRSLTNYPESQTSLSHSPHLLT